MPIISIIIPVFNAKKYLKRCVDSVIESIDGVDGEILLVDNDSSDDLGKVIWKSSAKDSPF